MQPLVALFHITTKHAWQAAERRGIYIAPSIDTEGFIHLSTEEQVPRTLARFFAGQTGLLLLRIDPVRLASELRYEAAHGELFPHLYGPLELDAVVTIESLD
jgi:uncharacterized protein (DUF952 family)